MEECVDAPKETVARDGEFVDDPKETWIAPFSLMWNIEVEKNPKNDSRLLDAFDNLCRGETPDCYEYIVDAANAKDKDGALLPPCIESPGSNSAYPF